MAGKYFKLAGLEKKSYFRNPPRRYVNPADLPRVGMLMAVKGGKAHVTVFTRSERAPGAGHPEVKRIFAECVEDVKKKLSEEEWKSRPKRNAEISKCILNKMAASGEFEKVA